MPTPDSFEVSTTLQATSMQVLFAFLDPQAIKAWWKAKNAVVQPRPGGLFVVEWEPGARGEDDLLGPLGGVLAGVLDNSMAGHFVHFGALHWLTPRGDVFGPTRLEVDVFSKNDPRRKPTLLKVRGSAYREGERWARCLEIARRGWERTISDLGAYCESQVPQDVERAVESLGTTYLAEAVLKDRRIS